MIRTFKYSGIRFSPRGVLRLRMEIRRETVNESWEHFPVNKVTLYLIFIFTLNAIFEIFNKVCHQHGSSQLEDNPIQAVKTCEDVRMYSTERRDNRVYLLKVKALNRS